MQNCCHLGRDDCYQALTFQVVLSEIRMLVNNLDYLLIGLFLIGWQISYLNYF